MSVDVVGSVLSVVFHDEGGSVIPIGTARDSLDYAAEGKIVVRDRSGGTRLACGGAMGVVVGQIEQDERRQLTSLAFPSLAFLPSANEAVKFIQKFVGAKLVRILGVEVGKQRVEVVAQHILSWLGESQYRNRPWPWTG